MKQIIEIENVLMEDVFKQQGRILSALEVEKELSGDGYKKYRSYHFWTATHMKYDTKAATAKVWDEGKEPEEIVLPFQNNWYLPEGKYGIPNGECIGSSNPNARYLWRWQDRAWEGLVVRRCWDWGGGVRRGVNCVCGGDYRCGVLVEREVPDEAKPEMR